MEMSDDEEPPKDMNSCVLAVQQKLNYQFKNKKLLEEALTHPSSKESTSYQRLEFIGDAVLGLVVANAAFLAYPTADEGILSLLRSVNTSTLRLARVAVRHGLYRCFRHNDVALEAKVREFVFVAEAGDENPVYGGATKAPKVLADIVESVIGAVYFDCDFDLKFLWQVIRGLLEPLVTLETLPVHIVTMVYEFGQKEGRKVDIKHSSKGVKNMCNIYVDGKLVATGTSDQKNVAQLRAARQALEKLNKSANEMDIDYEVNDKYEIESAKQKLHEICSKKKWPKPTYSIEKEEGLGQEKRYICSVEIKKTDGKLLVSGDEKPRIKMAENSAASTMIHSLVETSYARGISSMC